MYIHAYDISEKRCKSVARTQSNITVCVKTLGFLTEMLMNLILRVNNWENVLVLLGSADIS